MALVTPAPGVLADALPRSAVRNLALVLGGAAFVGLAAQIAVPLPFTPVPVTGQTFAVLLTAAALGTWRGLASLLTYALLGLAGVPWFAEGSSAFSGGVLTVSFGYVIGFIAAAGVVGWLAARGNTRTPLRTAGLMALGSLIIYAFGATWLALAIDVPLSTAVSLGVTPFVLGDLLKIALAAGLFPLAWRAVDRFARH